MATSDFQKIYDEGINWLIVNGPRIVIAAVVFLIGQGLIRLLKKWLNRVLNRKDFHSSFKPFLQSLVVVIFQILLIVVILQILGIQLTIFAAGIASFGVAVGLALSGTLQNFASGILILVLRPFKVGDNIIAQGQDGIVTSIQVFYTLIVTADNKSVIIPNSKLSNEVIINIAREGNKRIDFEFKFSHAEDMDKVEKLIADIVTPSDPAAVINVKGYSADDFTIKVQFWVDSSVLDETRKKIHRQIVEGLKSEGIKFAGMV